MINTNAKYEDRMDSQLATTDHVADDQDMPMPAYANKDPGRSEECEHLLSRFRSSSLPPFDTLVNRNLDIAVLV